MGTLLCPCGERLNNTISPSPVTGRLRSNVDEEELCELFDAGQVRGIVDVLDFERSVWECPECGRLAVSTQSRMKWYVPEDGKSGHLFRQPARKGTS